MITLKVEKHGEHFVGRVVCTVGGSRLWSQATQIQRTYRKDAHQDAVALAAEIIERREGTV